MKNRNRQRSCKNALVSQYPTRLTERPRRYRVRTLPHCCQHWAASGDELFSTPACSLSRARNPVSLVTLSSFLILITRCVPRRISIALEAAWKNPDAKLPLCWQPTARIELPFSQRQLRVCRLFCCRLRSKQKRLPPTAVARFILAVAWFVSLLTTVMS